MESIPKLAISSTAKGPKRYDSTRTYTFRYRAKRHCELPHVVKFSGGRSSGMLLFTLLENGFLKRDRGDLVVFNNTSCEHPATYQFVAECKRRVETDYGIPFFLVQFQTYEDARQGEWRRLPTYRLVNEQPFSDRNPDGFDWRGEAFEEMLSLKAYLPSQFRRVCTASLKLEVTRMFLRDWFASKESIPRLGHGMESSLVDVDQMHARHVRSGGGVPKHILLRKREYVLSQPTERPQQRYRDYSTPAEMFVNEHLQGKVFGRKAWFGAGGIEYVALIGLRGDEGLRVARVRARSSDIHANVGYEGEHVYMPLTNMHVGREDVNDFWGEQDWGLRLDSNGALSNCVYCFLKGLGNLERVHQEMEERKKRQVRGYGSTVDTPCDLDWWSRMERRYGRDLDEEDRKRTNPDAQDFIGFFGASSDFSYDILATSKSGTDLSPYVHTVLPCDCTE
ncbi:MAG: hypothetical protein OXL38_11015 [Gammaproteobacteria bacterium]|nr:hypothetical protein [Gammaproteobacteria bacterium]